MNLSPYFSQSEWGMLPIEMIRAFSGRSCLPVYECDECHVKMPRCRVLRHAKESTNLSFSAWRLAHAVKKADCTRWPSSRILWPQAAGFLFENIHLFDWNSAKLCLSPHMSDYYADFSRTSLSGRIGQGMALLFLEKKGYSYIGRFSTVFEQYGNALKKLKKYPDFVIEKSWKERALAEAKGSFVPPGSPSKVKDALKKALEQLDGWDKCLPLHLHKSFAIGTFLREIRDPCDKPSLMAFVDTKSEEPRDPVDFPSDAIRRANYASWFSLMGFDDAARRLQAKEGKPEQRTVPYLTLGGHQYVVAITSVRSSYRHHAHDPDFRRLIGERMGWLLDLWGSGVSMELIGLDLHVVRALETTIKNPYSRNLMDIKPGENDDILHELGDGEFHGTRYRGGCHVRPPLLAIRGPDGAYPAAVAQQGSRRAACR